MAHPAFDALGRKDLHLYRGAGCSEEAEVFAKVGVGPIRDVAAAVLRDQNRLGLSDTALKWITKKLSYADPKNVIAIPPLSATLALEKVLEADVRPTMNHLGANDHVLSESPLQTPSTYPDLQSAAKDPRIAILYAYGVRPDLASKSNDEHYFFRGQPNDFAAIAVMHRDADDPLAEPAAVAAEGQTEVKRRIARDSEVLLSAILKVGQVVELPRFDPSDKDASLDRAAVALQKTGLAS